MCAKSLQSFLNLCDPMDCSPAKLLCPCDSPGKNTGEDCHAISQGILHNQGLNSGLLRVLHWHVGSFPLVPFGKLPGAGVRSSAHGKGHEEEGSAYAKLGSSLRSPPGNSQASTPKTRVCLLSALYSHLHL